MRQKKLFVDNIPSSASIDPVDKYELFIIGGIIIIALVLRLLFIPHATVINTDGVGYARVAESLAKGNGLFPFDDLKYLNISPGYPIFIIPLYLLTGNLEYSARITSLLMSLASVIVIWKFASYANGKRSGLMAAALVATSPALIPMSFWAMSEPTFIFLLISLAFLSYRFFEAPNAKYAGALGLGFGMLYLTRPEGIFCSIFIIVGIFAKSLLDKDRRKEYLISGIAVTVILCIIMGIYMAFLHKATGKWSISGKSHNNWFVSMKGEKYIYSQIQFGLNEDATIMGTDRFEEPDILNELFQNPSHYIKRYVMNFLRETKVVIVGMGILSPFVLLGLAALFGKKEKRLLNLIILAFLIPLLIYPLLYIQGRNIKAFIPILYIYSAEGILALSLFYNKLKSKRKLFFEFKRGFVTILGILVLLTILFPTFIKAFNIKSPPAYLEHKTAGKWLGKEEPNLKIVMSRKPWVAYYSGKRHINIPYDSLERILLFAKNYGVDVLVIDKALIPKNRPQLTFLLNHAQAPYYLKPIYIDESHPDKKLILYRFLIDKYNGRVADELE